MDWAGVSIKFKEDLQMPLSEREYQGKLIINKPASVKNQK